eukprot:s6754_g1.t1
MINLSGEDADQGALIDLLGFEAFEFVGHLIDRRQSILEDWLELKRQASDIITKQAGPTAVVQMQTALKQVERAEMEVQVVKAKQRRQELKCSVQEEPHWPEPDEQPFHCNLCGKPGKELSKLQKGSIRVSRVVLGGMFDCGCTTGVSRLLGMRGLPEQEASREIVEPSRDGRRFLAWLRMHEVDVVVFDMDACMPGEDDHTVQVRNSAGPMEDKVCGVAISFPFELLDIYLGAWAAACLPGMREERLLPEVPASLTLPGFDMELRRRRAFRSPDMCQHLKAVLCLDEFQTEGADPAVFNPDLSKLFARLQPELELRGLSDDRIATFKAKVQATHLLLLQIRDGHEDAAYWSARALPGAPHRQWSPEQQRVLDWVASRINISDATDTHNRVLQVSGAPGTGKTEVVIAAANLALADQCRVLIAGPIGLLVAMYRL